MWDGFNKRRFQRINLQCEISIKSDDTQQPISAVTENIGIGGVCVVLDKPLERFDRCHVRFEIDKNLPKIESHGRVVWIVPMRDFKSKKSLFDTGIEFIDIDPSIQHVLQEYLDSNAKDLTD
jgi:c-di-GMP-binding flagellar brake protein YcgR